MTTPEQKAWLDDPALGRLPSQATRERYGDRACIAHKLVPLTPKTTIKVKPPVGQKVGQNSELLKKQKT